MQALRCLTPQTGSLCRGLIGVAAAATLLAQAPAPTLSRRGVLRHYGRWRVLVDSGTLRQQRERWTRKWRHGIFADAAGFSGVLYGITLLGGTAGASGVVFALKPPASEGGTWTEIVLHNFAAGSDGAVPTALTMDASGVLYGTTKGGEASIPARCSPWRRRHLMECFPTVY